MVRGVILGIVLGVLLVMASVYFYFSTGSAPVAVTAPPMPFERTFARMGFHAYLNKLPHSEPQVPADDANFLAGAQVYKQNCAVCHGLPGEPKTNIAEGMAPDPPQLFHGKGVTDDEPWETYWTVANGVRMTGMPGFKGRLSDTQLWQVTMLLKDADKISAAVKSALMRNEVPTSTLTSPVTSPLSSPAAPIQ
ncbi:MAG: c-type cytochrome [Acidobacteriota bacterium]|nr:c-type cytochrome [Acidobacteriota bacterium]